EMAMYWPSGLKRILLTSPVGCSRVLSSVPGIIIQFFAGFIQSILTVTIPTESIELNFQLLLFLMGHIISLLGNVFWLPFWQTIKAVVYYDLRTRREGMDLQLRKQNI
ncbi:MAG: hypothetical protein F6K34_15915, partial [Okeania sp. SIO4D6]|nr:hypothetical protein [Okeania sp. SIO4D6]